MPPGLAGELAARSEAVAAKLEAGDPCGARATAESLRQEAQAAVASGRIPTRYRRELTAAAGALAASISCPPPDPPVAEDEDEKDEDEEDEGKDKDEEEGKKGKGKGKGKGKKGRRG